MNLSRRLIPASHVDSVRQSELQTHLGRVSFSRDAVVVPAKTSLLTLSTLGAANWIQLLCCRVINQLSAFKQIICCALSLCLIRIIDSVA